MRDVLKTCQAAFKNQDPVKLETLSGINREKLKLALSDPAAYFIKFLQGDKNHIPAWKVAILIRGACALDLPQARQIMLEVFPALQDVNFDSWDFSRKSTLDYCKRAHGSHVRLSLASAGTLNNYYLTMIRYNEPNLVQKACDTLVSEGYVSHTRIKGYDKFSGRRMDYQANCFFAQDALALIRLAELLGYQKEDLQLMLTQVLNDSCIPAPLQKPVSKVPLTIKRHIGLISGQNLVLAIATPKASHIEIASGDETLLLRIKRGQVVITARAIEP